MKTRVDIETRLDDLRTTFHDYSTVPRPLSIEEKFEYMNILGKIEMLRWVLSKEDDA